MAVITWRNVNNETTDSSQAYFKLADTLASIGVNLNQAIGKYDTTRQNNVNNFVQSRASMAKTPEQLSAEQAAIMGQIPVNLLTPEAINSFSKRQQELDIQASNALNQTLAKNRDSRESQQLVLQRDQFNAQNDQFNKNYALNTLQFNEGIRQFTANSAREDKRLNTSIDQFNQTNNLEKAKFDQLKTTTAFDQVLRNKELDQKVLDSNRNYGLSVNKDSRDAALHTQTMKESKAAFNQAEINRADANTLASFQNVLSTTPTYQEAISARNSISNGSNASPVAVAAMNSAINSKFGIPDVTIPTGSVSLGDALNGSTASNLVTNYGDINPAFNQIPVKVNGGTKTMGELINSNSSEFNNGGAVKLGTQALLTGVASSLGSNLSRVSAGNDAYHQDKTKVQYNSKHQVGDAFDITIDGISYTDALNKVKSGLSAQGLAEGDFKVLHEKSGQGASTGEHIHVELTPSGSAKMESKVKTEIASIQSKPNTSQAKDVAQSFVDVGKKLELLKKQASDAKSLVNSQVPNVSALRVAVPDGSRMGYANEVVKTLSAGMDVGKEGESSFQEAVARFNEFSASIESKLKAEGFVVDPANIAAAILHTSKSDTDLSRWLSITGSNFKDIRLDYNNAIKTAKSLQMGHFDSAIAMNDSYVQKVDTLSTKYAELDGLSKQVQQFKSAAVQGVPNADRAYREGLTQFNRLLSTVEELTSAVSKAPPSVLKRNAKVGATTPVTDDPITNAKVPINYLTGKPFSEEELSKATAITNLISRSRN